MAEIVVGKTDGTRWHDWVLVDYHMAEEHGYILRVDAQGASIRMFIDGEMEVNVRDGNGARGLVGVRIVYTHPHFGDF